MAMGRRRGRGDGRRAAGGRQGGRRPASAAAVPGPSFVETQRGGSKGRAREENNHDVRAQHAGKAGPRARRGGGAALPAGAHRAVILTRGSGASTGARRAGAAPLPAEETHFSLPEAPARLGGGRLLPQLRGPAFSGRPGPFPAGRAPSPP